MWNRRLGRTADHRKALLRNMATSLIENEQIETTEMKAKELSAVMDKLVTLAKRNDLHARRQAAAYVRNVEVDDEGTTALQKLFNEWIHNRDQDKNPSWRCSTNGNRSIREVGNYFTFLKGEKMNLVKEMNEFAKANHVPVMMDEGVELLIAKVKEYNCKSFLELGTAIARTAIRVASLDPEMRVVTIERNPEMIEQAKINIKQSGYQNQITLIEGDALEVELPDQKFDCIFIDAAKAQYTRFFKKYSPLLNSNGIIVTDNMYFHGLVEHPENTNNKNTKDLVRKIRNYHEFLSSLDEFETTLYSKGDGVAVTRRK